MTRRKTLYVSSSWGKLEDVIRDAFKIKETERKARKKPNYSKYLQFKRGYLRLRCPDCKMVYVFTKYSKGERKSCYECVGIELVPIYTLSLIGKRK